MDTKNLLIIVLVLAGALLLGPYFGLFSTEDSSNPAPRVEQKINLEQEAVEQKEVKTPNESENNSKSDSLSDIEEMLK